MLCLFTWVLGIQTQVLTLTEKARYPMSPLSSPKIHFSVCFTLTSGLLLLLSSSVEQSEQATNISLPPLQRASDYEGPIRASSPFPRLKKKERWEEQEETSTQLINRSTRETEKSGPRKLGTVASFSWAILVCEGHYGSQGIFRIMCLFP